MLILISSHFFKHDHVDFDFIPLFLAWSCMGWYSLNQIENWHDKYVCAWSSILGNWCHSKCTPFGFHIKDRKEENDWYTQYLHILFFSLSCLKRISMFQLLTNVSFITLAIIYIWWMKCQHYYRLILRWLHPTKWWRNPNIIKDMTQFTGNLTWNGNVELQV